MGRACVRDQPPEFKRFDTAGEVRPGGVLYIRGAPYLARTKLEHVLCVAL